MNSRVDIPSLSEKNKVPEEITKKTVGFLENFFKNPTWSFQEISLYLGDIFDENNFITTKRSQREGKENEISYQLSEKFIEEICCIKLPILLKNILEKRIQTSYSDKKIYKNLSDFSQETGQKLSLQNSLEKNILLIEDFIQNFGEQFDIETLSQILTNLKEEYQNLGEYHSQTQKISEFIKTLTLQTDLFPQYIEHYVTQAYESLKKEQKDLGKKVFIQKETNTIQTYKKVEKILENHQSNPKIIGILSNFKYQIFGVFLLGVGSSFTYDHFTKDPEIPYISKQEFQREFNQRSEKIIFMYASTSSSREEFEKHLREHTKDLNKRFSSENIVADIYIVGNKIVFSVKEKDEEKYIFGAPIPEKFIAPIVAEIDEKTKIQEDIQKIVNDNSKTKSLEEIVPMIEKSPVILENSTYDFYVKYEIDPKYGPRISVQIRYKRTTQFFTTLYFYAN